MNSVHIQENIKIKLVCCLFTENFLEFHGGYRYLCNINFVLYHIILCKQMNINS